MVIAFLVVMLFFQQPIDPPGQKVVFSDGLNFINYDLRYLPTELLQSSDGVLWIGTSYGVISFDGKNVLKYSMSISDTSEEGFYGLNVISINEDSQQNIWVGTEGGSINVLQKDSSSFESFYRFHRGLPFSARTIQEVQNGNYWTHAGLSVGRFTMKADIDDIKLVSRVFRPGEYGNFQKFYEGSDGRKYLLADGVYEVSYNEASGIVLNKILDGRQFSEMIMLSDDKYLIRDVDQLLIWSVNENRADTLRTEEIRGSYIRSILIDDKSYLWIASRNGVLKYSFDGNQKVEFIGEYSIGVVRDMIQDRTGNIFFSTPSGLKKLNRDYDQYTFYQLPEEFGPSYSDRYLKDENGNFWIGTKSDLLKYDADDKRYTSILTEQINSIIEFDKEHILTGTNSGVRLINTGTGRIISTLNRESSRSLQRFNGKTILGLQRSRLFKIENNELKHLDSSPGVVSLDHILTDNERIWAVSDRTLLEYAIKEDEVVLIEIPLDNSIPATVNWMEDDLNGNLWLSTDIGVLIFNKNSNEISGTLSSENGLIGDQSLDIIRDRSGLMWVKQEREGSLAIDPESMEVIQTSPEWLTFPGNNSRYSVSYSAKDGSLFTDGSIGFFVFHPDSLTPSPIPPIIKLRTFNINGDHVPALEFGRPLKLSYDQNDITLEYAGIQFDDPRKNTFRYRLDGYEDEWNNVKDRNDAQYLSLPPGNYRFLIAASNSSGVWSDEAELAAFSISPPWWRTMPVYLLYLIVFISILYSFIRLQFNRKLAVAETKRLNEIDSFKSRFFTNITHEFRTPLTVIMGQAGRVKGEKGISIKRNAQKLLGLINQILEISKLDSAKHSMKFQKADLLTYIQYLVQSYSSYADENDVILQVESDMEEIPAYFDKSKLSLIIENLISNAIKFTPSGGSISVFVSADEDTVRVEVTDTGIGITKEDQEKIFDRYFQSESVSSGDQGSGIGLSLTHELVVLMSGEITVRSEPDQGTVITVILPRMISGEDSESQINTDISLHTEPDVEDISDERDRNVILIIEDNSDVLDFVKTVVSVEFDVITAVNGDEGFNKALKVIPDLIISDVMMPGKDGVELTGLLKADQTTDHIPVILLTAKADIESRLEGLGGGADLYLTKPFNEEELMLHLNNLLSQRDRIREKYQGEDFSVETVEDEFISRVRKALLANISDEQFGIDEICRDVGISRSQMHRKLKALTGYSSAIFLRNIRLSESRKYLRSASDTVAEVAYKVGFGDPNYFSKLYSERYSISPSKDRKSST